MSLFAVELIDIGKRQGPEGFQYFMKGVEYFFPETFKRVTGRKARPAPEGEGVEINLPQYSWHWHKENVLALSMPL